MPISRSPKADALNLLRLSTVTIKNRLMALSSVLSYAVRMEYLDENPVTTPGITQQLAKASSKAAEQLRAGPTVAVVTHPGRWVDRYSDHPSY